MARALAANPPVLLMDEPFGAVDPVVRVRLQDEFLRLQHELGKTVVLVTHDIDEAVRMGDRVAIFAGGGRLAQYASPADLLGRPADDFVSDFVGSTRGLRRLAVTPIDPAHLEPLDGVRTGDLGAAILWLKPVRAWRTVEDLPKPPKWNRYAVRMKMFDNLICNTDRNAGNLLVDDDWNLYLIDHSRAFISDKKLVSVMTRIDRDLWEKMLALDEATLTASLGKLIDGGSIKAILRRRDAMKVAIDALIKKWGDAAYIQ